MSFLNSVLKNIGKEGATYGPIPDPPSSKRKAEDEPAASTSKISKKDTNVGPGAGRGITEDGAPKRSSQLQPIRQPSSSKPLSSSAPVTPTTETSKQPKKGSYQEIMARAKAQKDAPKPAVVGTISHKPKDKIEISHKQEKKMKIKAMRDKKLGLVRDSSGGPTSSEGSRSNSVGPGTKLSDRRKPKHAYSGTAKVKATSEEARRSQPTYRGTMGAKSDTVKRRTERPKPRLNANQYAGTDDELDSYEEGDGDDYGNSEDESDNMEAGFSDVEHEEAAALRMARKEDEEQLKLESDLKRQKETKKIDLQRKNALSALAAKQKPRQY